MTWRKQIYTNWKKKEEGKRWKPHIKVINHLFKLEFYMRIYLCEFCVRLCDCLKQIEKRKLFLVFALAFDWRYNKVTEDRISEIAVSFYFSLYLSFFCNICKIKMNDFPTYFIFVPTNFIGNGQLIHSISNGKNWKWLFLFVFVLFLVISIFFFIFARSNKWATVVIFVYVYMMVW